MNATRMLIGFAAFAVMTGAYALDGVWVNGETSAKQAWRTVGNWTDSSGAPATDFPRAAGDTATLTAPSDYQLQTIYTGGSDANGYGLTLDSVSGSAQHTINFGDSQTLGYTSQNYHYLTSDQKLTLTDPSGFFGYWANNLGRLFFSLKATAQNTPVLHALSLEGVRVSRSRPRGRRRSSGTSTSRVRSSRPAAANSASTRSIRRTIRSTSTPAR